jgi:hypothetical protein
LRKERFRERRWTGGRHSYRCVVGVDRDSESGLKALRSI